MYAQNKIEKDSNLAMVIRRLRSLYSGFNRKYDVWNTEQKHDYLALLESVDRLPVFIVRSGLKHLQDNHSGHMEPSVDVILSAFSSTKQSLKIVGKYQPDPVLEAQYTAAAFEGANSDREKSKAGWKKMGEIGVKMGAHYQAWARRAA